ncbi:MAG: hypothetical protein ACRDN0_03230 [Trebonia sp.]
MSADIVAEVVNAIATSAGESLTAKGVAAVGRLISALRARFRDHPESRGTLEIALDEPSERAALDNLAAVLRARAAQDAEFAAWLADAWAGIRPDIQADQGGTVNVVSGTVHGSVVQARDVHGGIHLGDN